MSSDEENIEIEDCVVTCYACGEDMNVRLSAMLICSECLNDECNEFLKEASAVSKKKTPKKK